MTIEYHQLQSSKGARRTKKRVGRGNSSGHGTYSTRGIKGQRARSGVSGLKRLGLKMMLLRIPKKRGFRSQYAANQAVNLDAISRLFADGAVIDPRSLKAKGLIARTGEPVKILGRGSLALKGLKFTGVAASESARQKIEAQGGKIA